MNIKDTQNSARKKADDLKDKVKSVDYEKEFNNIQSKVKKLDYKNPKNIIIAGFIIFVISIAGVFIFRDNSTSRNCKDGEVCDFNGLNIKVDGVIGGMINSISGASVDLTVENTTETNYSLSYSDFSVIDKDGMSHKAVLPGYKNEFTSETISGNSKMSVRIYFNIADYDTLTAIRIIDSSSNSKDYEFDGKGIKDQFYKESSDRFNARKEKEAAELQKEQDKQKEIEDSSLENYKSELLKRVNDTLATPLDKLPEYSDEVLKALDHSGHYPTKELLDRLQDEFDKGEVINNNTITSVRIAISDEAYAEFYKNNPDVKGTIYPESMIHGKSCELSVEEIIKFNDNYRAGNNYDCSGNELN